MDPDGSSAATMKIENTEKRDVLRSTEERYQKLWRDQKVFESNAPSCSQYPLESISPDDLVLNIPKYVNGAPHLGHGYTVSKVEFASRTARAQGKNTLYPQGYHATGMPIQVCADKLANEITMFGQMFDGYVEGALNEEPAPAAAPAHSKEDAKYQFQVMLSLGIPLEEIHKFADAKYWLHHFPQIWERDLTNLGCAIDWRRSFITTDENGYYDSFVRWQMRLLRKLEKIRFGKRYTVYSPKDRQPCLDHDRSSGEGVLVQEYIALKCKVKHWSKRAQSLLLSHPELSNARVFMVPATLRPETMYGQTNLFVSPRMTYGIFRISETDFICVTDRAARNMSFQGIFPGWGETPKVMELSGSDLVGSVVNAPLSAKGEIYILPMHSIKKTKGTGFVTSVPSDSPDDYAMSVELSKKADFYQIDPEWVCLDMVSIIETPEYGGTIAPALVQKLKINSPKDEQRLLEAKDLAYKTGFYQGKMVFGDFVGKSVQQAKPLIRQQLLDAGDAFIYCEPDGPVISRSGDECVAAFLDQWYLTYGTDKAWRDETLGHVLDKDGLGFNTFTSSAKHSLEQTLGWMVEWSVTRQYGLGTELPWDPSQKVEGLSDSTIYMAYYTIAHFLHSDIYGVKPGIGNIKVSQMSDDVWNYVFALTEDVKSDISRAVLNAMRREFTYWYPLDVRISGKDLIGNHLVFFLYIHQAVWGKKAPRYLPKAIRLNGHLMLNGDKMSKSTGNFLTLSSAIQKFGADATRMALADGGDGIDDANFEESTANAAILKLFELRKWIEEVMNNVRLLKPEEQFSSVREAEKIDNADVIQRVGAINFWDELFENELNTLICHTVQAYSSTNYKAALRSGFYELTSARDSYRTATSAASVGMHRDCVSRYVEVQALLVCVIAPHWADYVWMEVLKKPSTIQTATFPQAPEPNPSLHGISNYIRTVTARVQATDASQQKCLAKGKGLTFDPNKDKRLRIFVAKAWPAWQVRSMDIIKEMFDGSKLDMKMVAKKIDKADMKKAMPFIQDLKQRWEAGVSQEALFNRVLGFDEVEVLREMTPVIKSTVAKLKDVEIVVLDGLGASLTAELPQAARSAEPGAPSLEFVNQ
ncbi:hypothetical protein F4818DRAFT_450203 [Hypoxylon cercidicola]|nr:hypothetical protein F4818DRAFT_450203 [Hypoxylon cercidicola]